MPYLSLSNGHTADRKIMVFAEGTILKPRSLLALYDHRAYVPIGNAVTLIAGWEQQGAEIVYCTSRRGRQAQDMAELLRSMKSVVVPEFRGIDHLPPSIL
jgi:hypothetical protein